MNIESLPLIRSRAFQRAACAPEGHWWREVQSLGVTLLVICNECGRTPLEMLAELPVITKEVTDGEERGATEEGS